MLLPVAQGVQALSGSAAVLPALYVPTGQAAHSPPPAPAPHGVMSLTVQSVELAMPASGVLQPEAQAVHLGLLPPAL